MKYVMLISMESSLQPLSNNKLDLLASVTVFQSIILDGAQRGRAESTYPGLVFMWNTGS